MKPIMKTLSVELCLLNGRSERRELSKGSDRWLKAKHDKAANQFSPKLT
jgi:hypothetical protein